MWMLSEFCDGLGADVIFVIDGSRRLGTSYFQKIRHFVANVLSTIDVGPNKTRVGMISFRSTLPISSLHHLRI